MGSLQPRSLLQSNIPASSSEQETKLFSAATDQNEASTLMSDSNKNHRHHDEFHHQISYGDHVMNIQPNSSSSTHNNPASSNFMYSPFFNTSFTNFKL